MDLPAAYGNAFVHNLMLDGWTPFKHKDRDVSLLTPSIIKGQIQK